MKPRSPFRMLLKMFQNRFFEDDTVSPGSGFETNIYQVLGFLVTVGFFVAYLTMPAFLELSFNKAHSPAADWALRNFRLFFPALSFAAIGFTTVFQWDMLFPDRRDFLILSVFPVSAREIFAAKVAALAIFLGLLIGALNVFPTLASALFSLSKSDDWEFGLRLVTAQVAATAGSAIFAFLLVAAFQGMLINVTSPRIFRRVSPWIQMFGMSMMVLSIVTYPVYLLLLKPAVEARRLWLWFFPPVWFTGLYDILLPGGDPFFASLGRYAIGASAVVLLCFCLTWALGFSRHFRRTLEADVPSIGATVARRPARSRLRGLAGSPEEWAMFAFCRKTLARSTKHRLFLATWLSVGISAGIFVALSVRNGKLEWSPEGMRTFPFLIAFFVISGFRTVFQFPADLACNWLLRITESRWAETARRAARKTVLISGLVPVLLAILPFEIFAAGPATGLLHVLIQLAAGALLIELMFWRFGKVPFTCSYFAGRTSLSILAAFYLYGFTTYSFNMADLEKALEGSSIRPIAFFAVAAAALAVLWRRSSATEEVIFNDNEPVIRTLDLN
ncbi:MAG TPA: hypothetical protein VHY84_14695 [Bryobacteraceae bacterium]|nr:hypothetical protein [Bryobacteraceae bacterium]